MSTTYTADAPVKVLIVDGDPEFRARTSHMLGSLGYACSEAASGTQAHAALESDQEVAAALCDVVISDEPRMNVLMDLTADFPEVAVVMMTGADNPGVAAKAFGSGVSGYLVKPFDTVELLKCLRSALRRRDTEVTQRREVQLLEQAMTRTRRLGGVLGALEDSSGPSLHDEEVMERLSRAVSLRDDETGRHIERMSRYAVVLAEAVGYTARPLESLRLATALHDVGKIGIADAILLKPGSLSRPERLAMQSHAQIGYRFLADSTSELLRVAADIALSHHEWWDGDGYPRGLKHTEISEEARIAAVTDVFDALTSNRVYHSAMSFEDARAVMAELRGRQFEPRLLDAFFASMDEIAAIRRRLPDQEDGPERIRVLLVDDNEIFRHSLVRLLESRQEFKVVGTAGSVAEAVRASAAQEPDVILMDFELPDGDGPLATARIKAITPAAKIIMLTVRSDDDSLVRAISAGCSGFVKKDDAVDDLLEAITAVHEGETISSPSELAALLRRLQPTRRGLGADLTSRELAVLRLMAGGLVNKQIAQQLAVSLNTVRNHVQSVSGKLHAHSKLEAVATAVREGIVGYGGGERITVS